MVARRGSRHFLSRPRGGRLETISLETRIKASRAPEARGEHFGLACAAAVDVHIQILHNTGIYVKYTCILSFVAQRQLVAVYAVDRHAQPHIKPSTRDTYSPFSSCWGERTAAGEAGLFTRHPPNSSNPNRGIPRKERNHNQDSADHRRMLGILCRTLCTMRFDDAHRTHAHANGHLSYDTTATDSRLRRTRMARRLPSREHRIVRFASIIEHRRWHVEPIERIAKPHAVLMPALGLLAPADDGLPISIQPDHDPPILRSGAH